MAIDTQTKRRSTLGMKAGPRVLPVPVSGVNLADRMHIWLYSGISAGAPVVITDDGLDGRVRGGWRRRRG